MVPMRDELPTELRAIPPHEYASRMTPLGTRPGSDGGSASCAAGTGRQKVPSESPSYWAIAAWGSSSTFHGGVLFTPWMRSSNTSAASVITPPKRAPESLLGQTVARGNPR